MSFLCIISLGDANTGKNNSITRFAGNLFSSEYPPTIEDAYSARLGNITLTATDLGGADDYDRLRTLYSKGPVDFFVATYAVNGEPRLENLGTKWVPLTRHLRIIAPMAAVACKANPGEPGSRETGFLCSALQGWWKEIFETIVARSGFSRRARGNEMQFWLLENGARVRTNVFHNASVM